MVKQTARLDGEEMSGGGIVEVTREEAVAIQKAALVMLMQAPPEERLAHVSLPERYTVDHIRAVYQSLPEFDEESLRARGVITRAAQCLIDSRSAECTWNLEGDWIVSTCGESWLPSDDWDGEEHGMKFCAYCGARLLISESLQDLNKPDQVKQKEQSK